MSTQLCQTENIRSEYADDPDFAELLELFLDSTQSKGSELREAFASQQWDAIRVIAHQLKGAGGGDGFSGLTSVAGDVESACKSNDIQRIGATLNQLLSYIERLAL